MTALCQCPSSSNVLSEDICEELPLTTEARHHQVKTQVHVPPLGHHWATTGPPRYTLEYSKSV